MNILETLHTYFRGEKIEALYYIVPVGLMLIGLGVTALKAERGGFAWGLAIPSFLFGLLLIATGLTVGLRTNGQVAALERGLRENPQQVIAEELPRMESVMSTFRTTLLLFGVMVVLGLVAYYSLPFDWARAAGIILIIAGGLGILIDEIASRRAVPYIEALRQAAG